MQEYSENEKRTKEKVTEVITIEYDGEHTHRGVHARIRKLRTEGSLNELLDTPRELYMGGIRGK